MSVSKLKNLLRGKVSHRHARHKILSHIAKMNSGVQEEINPFLLKDAYKLRQQEWIGLAFDNKDWSDLSILASSENNALKLNVVHLLEQHIIQNADAVGRLEQVADAVSRLILSEPETKSDQIVSSVSGTDRQSLFFWRLITGAYNQRGSLMFSRLRDQMKTDWLVQRFLYPFAFQGLNASPEQFIPSMLDYVLSGQEAPWELKIIEYAAGYTSGLIDNEVPFFWAAMLMHPYDAIELISDCLDLCTAHAKRLPEEFNESFERILSETNNRRLKTSFERYKGTKIGFGTELSPSQIQLNLPEPSKQFLVDCVTRGRKPCPPIDSPFLKSIANIRLNKYPETTDYDAVVYSSRIWKFLEAGRFLHGYSSALFMFPRASKEYEYRAFSNLVDFLGMSNPFSIMSPGLSTANKRHDVFDCDWVEIETEIETTSRDASTIKDRTWIQDLIFDVSKDQQNGLVQPWIRKIEKHSHLKRNYVCGADWSWLDNVVKSQKVRPFRGNLKAAYVFLLRNIEKGDPDYAVVKSILRPLIEGSNLHSLIDTCNSDLGEKSTAFLYYFLNPENILMTELAFSEIDALAGRIHALETCIQRFGFCEIVTEEVYLDELKLLTAAIAYKKISPSKFEIPWESFVAEQMIRTADFYETNLKLSKSISDGLYLLGDAHVENTVSFPNQVVKTFTLKNHEWVTAEIPLEIVKNFMADPGFGMEAILGTRIRHNELEHEFQDDIGKVRQTYIPGILEQVKEDVFPKFQQEIRKTIFSWNDKYIQTPRKDKPNGVFELVPTQKELEKLVSDIGTKDSHREMVNCAISWVQDKVKLGARHAQNLVIDELSVQISNTISVVSLELQGGGSLRAADVTRISDLIKTETTTTLNRVKHWFSWPQNIEVESLSVSEISDAVAGRYEREIINGKLRLVNAKGLDDLRIPRDSVRMIFDVFSELIFNAMKYSTRPLTAIRVNVVKFDGSEWLSISNLSNGPNREISSEIAGKRFANVIDHLMHTGGSGHKRVAGSFSTAVKSSETIRFLHRPKSFHVLLPVGPLKGLTEHD